MSARGLWQTRTMKITFFEVEKWEKDRYRTRLRDVEPVFSHETAQETDLAGLIDSWGICVFIYSQLTSDMLGKFPELKLIATRSTGFDHIDIDYCKKRKICVAVLRFFDLRQVRFLLPGTGRP
jgi:D-lactate dehydrogenase